MNDANGLPGSTVLDSWSLANMPNEGSGSQPDSLISSGGVTLSSGTQYWVLAGGSRFSADDWNTNDTGESGYALGQGSGIGQLRWSYQSDATPAFDVLGTPNSVPEPGLPTLLGTEFLAMSLAGLFWRKAA